MRYYLDTNTLIFLLLQREKLSKGLYEVLGDFGNILLTSTVCVQEFIHLCQIGKLGYSKRERQLLQPAQIMERIARSGVQIVPVNQAHLQVLSELPLLGDHRDPNDRLIIAQAICDRIPLVSSDSKFAQYVQYGLDFIYNER